MVFKFEPSLTEHGFVVQLSSPTPSAAGWTHPVCITVDIDTTCAEPLQRRVRPVVRSRQSARELRRRHGRCRGDCPSIRSTSPAGARSPWSSTRRARAASAAITRSRSAAAGPWAEARGRRIGGTPSVGSVLSGTNADWVDRHRPFSGAGCAATPPGRTARTYPARPARPTRSPTLDLGRTIRFRNDATDVDGDQHLRLGFRRTVHPVRRHARGSHWAQATEFTTGSSCATASKAAARCPPRRRRSYSR